MKRKLDPAVFGGDFTVSGIYVEHDKGIYLTVYEYDPETLFISRVSIQNFYEDGTYAGEVFSQKVSCLMNARTLLVSSFSEDDNAVYFALLDNGTAEVFSALKNNSEPAAKIAGHRLPGRGDIRRVRVHGRQRCAWQKRRTYRAEQLRKARV